MGFTGVGLALGCAIGVEYSDFVKWMSRCSTPPVITNTRTTMPRVSQEKTRAPVKWATAQARIPVDTRLQNAVCCSTQEARDTAGSALRSTTLAMSAVSSMGSGPLLEQTQETLQPHARALVGDVPPMLSACCRRARAVAEGLHGAGHPREFSEGVPRWSTRKAPWA